MTKGKELLLLGLAAVPMFAFTGCGTRTVDLNDYVTITAEGYNTRGTAYYEFDTDAFVEDYGDKIKINTKGNGDSAGMGLWADSTAAEMMLDYCVGNSLDQRSGLSNGDVVTLQWECDDEMAEEYFNCKLKYSDITYTVSDLTEVGVFNPFDYVDVSFTGVSPNGEVVITPDESREEVQYIDFWSNPSRYIEDGEEIEVTARLKISEEEFMEKFGSILEETAKTYTADSLGAYITKVEDIPEELMNEMIEKGEELIREDAAEHWDDPNSLVSIEPAGNYFLTRKDSVVYDDDNIIYLLYKMQANNQETAQTVDYYSYVEFYNVVRYPDGTGSVDLEDYFIPRSVWLSDSFSVGEQYYGGFQTLDKFEESCINYKYNFDYTTNMR